MPLCSGPLGTEAQSLSFHSKLDPTTARSQSTQHGHHTVYTKSFLVTWIYQATISRIGPFRKQALSRNSSARPNMLCECMSAWTSTLSHTFLRGDIEAGICSVSCAHVSKLARPALPALARQGSDATALTQGQRGKWRQGGAQQRHGRWQGAGPRPQRQLHQGPGQLQGGRSEQPLRVCSRQGASALAHSIARMLVGLDSPKKARAC